MKGTLRATTRPSGLSAGHNNIRHLRPAQNSLPKG
jgi:hypothetical protein